MKKKLVTFMVTAATVTAMLAGCGGQESAAPSEQPAQESAADVDAGSETENSETEEEAPAAEASEQVVLKCVCDLTPHSEILNAAADQLAQQGIELDIVSTTWDATWNDMLVDGDIDFAYFMHVPAMESIEEEMGVTLYSMGGVHVEP